MSITLPELLMYFPSMGADSSFGKCLNLIGAILLGGSFGSSMMAKFYLGDESL
jgi:hypothetical protein